MWYVLQTMTGKEEELVCMIKKIVSSDLYTDCFVAYYERLWRKQQRSVVHVERLFPSYVFIVTDKPNDVFQQLKKVPAMSKLMADDNFTFLALEKEEELFLEVMLGENHIVPLSYIETDGNGHIYQISGFLKDYKSQIKRYQFKKRYVVLGLKMMGTEKTIVLGIILKEDIRQEITYGKVEIPIKMPDAYCVERSECKHQFAIGDHVKVTSGVFENMEGVIWNIKKYTVDIGIHLFGQDVSIEMPINNIC